MDRRTYLTLLASGVAGSGYARRATAEADGGAWPRVTSPRIDDWRAVERHRRAFERSLLGAGVTGRARTEVYEYEALRRELERSAGVRAEEALATFFATRIDLRGYFTAAVSASAVGEQVKPEFVDRLENRGVESVREVEPRRPTPAVGGQSSQTYEYRGEYALSGETADAERVPVVGLFAAWKQGTARAYAAGGAYPAPDGEWDERGDTGAANDSAAVGTRFAPPELRRELVDLTESVE